MSFLNEIITSIRIYYHIKRLLSLCGQGVGSQERLVLCVCVFFLRFRKFFAPHLLSLFFAATGSPSTTSGRPLILKTAPLQY